MTTLLKNWSSLLASGRGACAIMVNTPAQHKPEFGYDNEQTTASLFKGSITA
jgi:hypothetical protein